MRRIVRDQRGQATLLLVGGLAAVLVGALVLGAVARGIGAQGREQRAADLAALAGAHAMAGLYARLFAPATIAGRPNPGHLEKAGYLARASDAARAAASANGAHHVAITFPDADAFAPVRIRVAVSDPVDVPLGSKPRELALRVSAEAELDPGAGALGVGDPGTGYRGPLAYRQGKPMRPDVALAFDRLEAAARAGGVALVITSAYRSDAEQARLYAAHPDPKWVAPPGHSLHRLGTELDLGPASAYGWLAAHAPAFGFKQRYSWEPWHYGLR